MSLFSGGEVDAIIGVCHRRRECSTATTSSVSLLGANWSCGSCHSVPPMMQPPALQPEPPSSLQRLRPASDAAEGPWLERPRAIWTPNVHVLLVGALRGEEDLQLNQVCSVINSWNKLSAAAILTQNEHRTRVKCRMWICSEMLVLTWMYFSSHRPLHLFLTLYNQTCLSGKKTRTVRITHKKNGITNIIQPSTVSPA